MDIERAKKLKVNDTVHFPEDRGEPKGFGRVTHITTQVCKNFKGAEYIWIEVRPNNGFHKSVWSSNRLG